MIRETAFFLWLILAILILSLVGPSRAETYPDKPIKIVVPYAAGGATDILARQLAVSLSEELSVPVIVENRPGAGGIIGSATAAAAKPDGYTLFLGQVSSHGITPGLYKSLPYDPKADFAPIAQIMSIPNVMVVNTSNLAHTVSEFLTRNDDQTIVFGSSGVGTSVHVAGEMFKVRTNLKMTHVPFRGSAEAVPALIAGDVDVIFENLPTAIGHIRSGALRALAVTSAERSTVLPETPTLSELNIPELREFNASSWFGLLTQDDVDPKRIEIINEAVNRTLTDQKLARYAITSGGVIVGGSPSDFAAWIDQELIKWSDVIYRSGLADIISPRNFILAPFFLPKLLIGTIGVLVLACVPLQFRSSSNFMSEETLHKDWRWRSIGITIILGAYYFLPLRVGMLVVAIIATLALLILAGERRITALLLVGFGAPIIIHGLFVHVITAPLP